MPATVVNLATNPSMETLSGSTPVGCTVNTEVSINNITTGVIGSGTRSARYVRTGTAATRVAIRQDYATSATCTLLVKVKLVASAARSFIVVLRPAVSSSTGQAGIATNLVLQPNVVTEIRITYTSPSSAAQATSGYVWLIDSTTSAWAVSDELIFDDIMHVAGTYAGPYLDGDSAGWAWAGTAHASTSSGPETMTQVVKTLVTSWGVLATTAESRATSWATRSLAAKTSATTWAVRTSVAKTSATSWDVAATAQVSKTVGTSWATRAQATETRASTWAVRTVATKPVATVWAVREGLEKTTSTAWSVRATTTTTQGTSWVVRTTAGMLLAVLWDVLSSIIPTDITVTGTLGPRRWAGANTPRVNVGNLAPDNATGTLNPTTRTGTTDRRWKGTL